MYGDNEVVYPANQQYEAIGKKDGDFMRWFLEVEKQIDELANQLRGLEKTADGKWVESKHTKDVKLMNEQGVRFVVNYIRSIAGRTTQSSAFDEEHANFVMRERIGKDFIFALEQNYFTYGFKNAAAMNSVISMVSHLAHCLVNGARNQGYRAFLTKTHSVQEIKQQNIDQNRGGVFGNLFKRNQNPQEQFYMQGGMQ